jgi:catechol 2,3-dioxygenase-like lactoylglutathione lyase family enzyme
MTLRWSHAVVYVRDLERMLAFYTGPLGFRVSDRGPIAPGDPPIEVVFLSQVATDHHQLAFVPVRGDGPPTTVDHFAFRVDHGVGLRDRSRVPGEARLGRPAFVREEVEPLDLAFPHPVRAPRRHRRRRIIDPLKEQVRATRACGPATSGPSSAARATAR